MPPSLMYSHFPVTPGLAAGAGLFFQGQIGVLPGPDAPVQVIDALKAKFAEHGQ